MQKFCSNSTCTATAANPGNVSRIRMLSLILGKTWQDFKYTSSVRTLATSKFLVAPREAAQNCLLSML